MAKKNDNGAALALPTTDELADLGDFDFETDGLGPAATEDMRIAVRTFNLSRLDNNGEPIPKNAFFDTVTEESTKKVRCVLLGLKKTHQWAVYDETDKRNRTICRSADRKVGLAQVSEYGLTEGAERPCDKCPNAKWETGDDGKRKRDCSTVYNLIAIDLDTGLPFVIRFKKTSERAIKTHLQKHHIGRRVVGGKVSNYPLFVFEASITLKMDEGGNYAIPIIERGDVLPKAQIQQMAEYARPAMEMLEADLERFEDMATEHEGSDGSSPDASFDPNDFTDGAGEDFTAEAPAG